MSNNKIKIDNNLIRICDTAPTISSHNNVNTNLKIYQDEYESINISVLNIKSSVYEYELFAMLETIKQTILTEFNIPEEQFNDLYQKNKNKLNESLQNKLDSNKILNKLAGR